jgi:hypothetical protein
MHFADWGHTDLSAEPNESQGWVAVGWDDQESSRSARLDAAERYLGDGITRAEIMEYISQTYGPVFVEDLIKHLSTDRDVGRGTDPPFPRPSTAAPIPRTGVQLLGQ